LLTTSCSSRYRNPQNIAIWPVKSPFHIAHVSHFDLVFGRPLCCALILLKQCINMWFSNRWITDTQAAFLDSIHEPSPPQKTNIYPSQSKRDNLHLRVGLSPNGLPPARFQDKWQIWDGKRKTCFSPSWIVTFLPVQNGVVPVGPKCDVFPSREGCDKKGHKFKNIFVCESSHSSQKCDKCNASHFLSPKKVTNVTSLAQNPRREPGNKFGWDVANKVVTIEAQAVFFQK